MNVSKMIKLLQNIEKEHGDLPIVGGYICDDQPPKNLALLDEDGCDALHHATKPVEVFIE